MSTPLPGQIRCPTCHRSTPPTAFCVHCGMPIPASARARPRGLDRDELQDRIRLRRPGDAAFRRGAPSGEGWDEGGRSAYRPFRPEPEDELLHPASAADEGGPSHVDHTPPGFDQPPPPVAPPPQPVAPATPPVVPPAPVFRPPAQAAPPPAPMEPAPMEPTPSPPEVMTPPADVPVVAPTPRPAAAPPPPLPEQRATAPVAPAFVPPPAPPPPPAPTYDEPRYGSQLPPAEPEEPQPYDDFRPYDYRYATAQDDRDRPDGMSPLAIGGFVLLGILAIGVGAFIAGIFGGGVAQATPTPTVTPSASVAPSTTPEASLAPSPSASVAPSTPAPSLPPFVFADGFTARAEPCAEEPDSQEGCGADGATVSEGSVWVWVGFRKGNDADQLGVTVVDAAGATVGNGSLSLGSIGCGESCSGWARFRFGGLDPGNYAIHVTRNDEPAAEATFTVTG